MLSELTLLALASAAVEYDFRISNSRDLELGDKRVEQHILNKRNLVHEKRSVNASSNDTIAPVINATLSPSYNFYYGNLLVGQPSQKFEVLLDTGSPVSWLYGPEGSYHNASRFFPNKSLTYKADNSSFSAEYGSGIYLGHWGSDLVAAPQFVASNITHNITFNYTVANVSNATGLNVTGFNASHNASNATGYNLTWDLTNSTLINATAFNNSAFNASVYHNVTYTNVTSNTSIVPFSVPFEFGLVSSFSTAAGAPGLLGLGPHIDGAGPKNYLSLPETYYKYNVTSSPAFSVFLEGDKGRFTFGGADLKYVKLPFYKYSPQTYFKNETPTSYTVTLDSIAFDAKTNVSINSTATLDSGSPVSLLPSNLVKEIAKALKFSKHKKYDAYYSKDGKIPNGTLSIQLNGGLVIDAPISSFLVPGHYIWLEDGPKNVTALGLVGSSTYLLGDAFFRNSYAVLNPANGDVLVAQRSKVLINSTNSTNASTVIALDKLLKNKTAVVDVSRHIKANSSKKITSKSGEYKTATNAYAYFGNEYIGTVDAVKAASVRNAAASGSASSASESASSSKSSSKSSSSSTSSKSKNAAASNGVSSALLFVAAPILALL